MTKLQSVVYNSPMIISNKSYNSEEIEAIVSKFRPNFKLRTFKFSYFKDWQGKYSNLVGKVFHHLLRGITHLDYF